VSTINSRHDVVKDAYCEIWLKLKRESLAVVDITTSELAFEITDI